MFNTGDSTIVTNPKSPVFKGKEEKRE